MCDNTEEISGFIMALSSFGKYLSNDMIDGVELSGLRFLLTSRTDLIFAMSVDDDDTKWHRTVLTEIVDLFGDLYDTYSFGIEDEIDIEVYQEFPKFLVDQEILQLNCGKYVECEGCPNRERSLPLREMTSDLDSKKRI